MKGICGKCGRVGTNVRNTPVLLSEVGTANLLLCDKCKTELNGS